MADAVLALNAGSSSVKLALFRLGEQPEPLFRALLEDQGDDLRLSIKSGDGATPETRSWQPGTAHADMMGEALDRIEHHLGSDTLVAAGHRIVHGGRDFVEPVRLDDDTIAAIDKLTPLAPLHQPRSLEPIRALRRLRPTLPQVGCFDTAFHHNLSPPVSRYAIPRRFEDAGIRKYGFHGLSYEFIAGRLASLDPALPGKRTIVAHLGNGASLCAMQHGQSRDTTMGFTALDGLVMGTRCGTLDPGVVLYLQQAHGLSAGEVEQMLYRQSGLLGVSEISGDMRVLSKSDDVRAREAIALFGFRIARETAGLANTLGGIDALVFTGGIGEHAPDIRADICERLGWLGIALDQRAGDGRKGRISHADSRVSVWVVETDEESVIARHTAAKMQLP